MMVEEFLSKYPDRQMELEAMQVNCESKELFCENCITAKQGVYNILTTFEQYHKERSLQSQSFIYWNSYISDLFLIVRNVNNVLPTGNG